MHGRQGWHNRRRRRIAGIPVPAPNPHSAMLRTIFGFEMPTRLLFGQGAVENLGFECSLNGWASALIVTDAGVHIGRV
jgi:hypothetical protein